MRVGVISDTHGHLPVAALELLAGCDHVLHAGDVGDGVLEALEALGAPVTAVLGNTDPPSARLPLERRLELAGTAVLMRHIQMPPDRLAPRAVEEFALSGARVVVFGHTHIPVSEERGGVLFANPGSAGQPRHGFPPSVGYLTLGEGPPRFEVVSFGDSE